MASRFPHLMSLRRRHLAVLATSGVLLLAAGSTWGSPSKSEHPRWCRVCHTDTVFDFGPATKNVHADVGCRECHLGYQFDPHEPVERPTNELVGLLAKRGLKNPAAWSACFECHDAMSEAGAAYIPHGTSKDGKAPGVPFCGDCHGSPHAIAPTASLSLLERRTRMNERCVVCHDRAAGMPGAATPVAAPADATPVTAGHAAEGAKGHGGDGHKAAHAHGHAATVAAGYGDTVHGRLLQLGSTKAPGCLDCHGGHQPVDMSAHSAAPCDKCHKSATPAFRQLAIHVPVTKEGRPVSWWTQKFFGWLTFLTILALAIHVLLDAFATTRDAWRKAAAGPKHQPPGGHVPPIPQAAYRSGKIRKDNQVQRFDVHQRISHGLMALSFTMLALTGWPLSTSNVGASRSLMDFFGGVENCGTLHRIAAIGLILASVHHLMYLISLAIRRKLPISMAPMPRDVRDVIHNLLYFIGVRRTRPRYDRFSYFEKFDYWAVFWGVVIMGGSGAIRWFPETVADMGMPWLYEIGYLAHTDEALLAGMAIFLWHFYNVHLRPAVFPMSWVFLHGRLTLEEMHHEHPDELDRIIRTAREEGSEPEEGGRDSK